MVSSLVRQVFLWVSIDPFWLNLTMQQLHHESWRVDGQPIVDGVYAMCGTFWNTSDPTHPTIDINETSYEAVCGPLERSLRSLGIEMHMFLGGMVPAEVLAHPESVAASATALARRHGWAGYNVDDEQECAPRANLSDFAAWATGMSTLGRELSTAKLSLSVDVQSIWGIQDAPYTWHAPCDKAAWQFPPVRQVEALLNASQIPKWVSIDTYGPGQGKSTGALGEFLDATDYYANLLSPSQLVVGIQGGTPRANDTDAIVGRMRAIWDRGGLERALRIRGAGLDPTACLVVWLPDCVLLVAGASGMAFWRNLIGEEWRPWLVRWKTSCAKCHVGNGTSGEPTSGSANDGSVASRACWTLEADCGEREAAYSSTNPATME